MVRLTHARRNAGSFDVLDEKFNHAQLLFTIAVVLIATVVVRHLSNKKQLVAAWK